MGSERASWRRAGGAEGAESGQATVGFVATLPLVAALCLLLVQLAFCGYAAWSAANAARAGARAALIGTAPAEAARAALPEALRRRAEVSSDGPEVEVEVAAARAIPGVGPIRISSRAAMEATGGR